ncbi:hypothetical protein F4803DRAFT_537684 [Xylaria telfairii]|nr:hypothetical protein F4803DRAFT_537684 [Xylaria telfairii]
MHLLILILIASERTTEQATIRPGIFPSSLFIPPGPASLLFYPNLGPRAGASSTSTTHLGAFLYVHLSPACPEIPPNSRAEFNLPSKAIFIFTWPRLIRVHGYTIPPVF